jgi:outer membrane protein insertion porin family
MQKIVSVIVLLLFLCPGSPLAGYSQIGQPGVKSPQDPPDITSVQITIQDAPGLEEELADLAHDLIALERGQPLTDVSLIQALDALKTSRRFAYIDVQSTQDVSGIALFFTLKPYRLIKNIRMFGKFPLFEKDVLKAMTLYIGGVFTPEALPVQERRIKDLYKSEGFIDPKVRVEEHLDKDEHTVELHVYIERGPFYRIDGIKITGNQAFSDFRLK